jgi:hypothetical protein
VIVIILNFRRIMVKRWHAAAIIYNNICIIIAVIDK